MDEAARSLAAAPWNHICFHYTDETTWMENQGGKIGLEIL